MKREFGNGIGVSVCPFEISRIIIKYFAVQAEIDK
ncbi:hypothetical protein Barb7_00385 [Bacteroidales bacterium Barb7]|nr:hypothetical protein Barb7_00385 [Bacteroidales bacterium Barb7]